MMNAYANRPTPGAPRTADLDYANAFADATNAVRSTTLINTTVPPSPTKVATSAPMCDTAVGIGALLTSATPTPRWGRTPRWSWLTRWPRNFASIHHNSWPPTFHDSFN